MFVLYTSRSCMFRLFCASLCASSLACAPQRIIYSGIQLFHPRVVCWIKRPTGTSRSVRRIIQLQPQHKLCPIDCLFLSEQTINLQTFFIWKEANASSAANIY